MRLNAFIAVAAAVALLATGRAAARPRMDLHTYALSLVEDGKRNLARGDLDHRRKGLALFEDAAIVAPRELDVLITLGDAYVDAVYLHRARTTFERALKVAPDSPEAHFGLARMARREWLDSDGEDDLNSALVQATTATRLRPGYAAALEALAALDIEHDDLAGACAAAESALVAAPQEAHAQLAAAEMAYRTGKIVRADSLFRLALAGLEPAVAARFTDITPLVPERDNEARSRMDPAEQARVVHRFWATHDPDPVTPQNEAELEYWARQAHALALLGNPWGPIWRERTATYVRYGKHVQIEDPMGGPHHEMPRLDLGAVADAPTPGQLQRLGQVTTDDGQTAFAPLPPGSTPLAVAERVVRFGTGDHSRLLAQAEVPGAPNADLTADFVVLDADGNIVARGSSALSPSACDPAATRVGDFDAEVPPGPYVVAVAVHGAGAQRGVRRASCDALPGTSALAMSDIAPNCGPPEIATGRASVRLNPNPRARVEGDQPLVVYFEIENLRTEGRNESRFEYAYSVRELGAPGVPWYRQHMNGSAEASSLGFKTTQEGVGSLRRQFVRVPTRVLPAGRYEIEIKVHDLVSGRNVTETMTFSRLWSAAELSGEAPLPGEK